MLNYILFAGIRILCKEFCEMSREQPEWNVRHGMSFIHEQMTNYFCLPLKEPPLLLLYKVGTRPNLTIRWKPPSFWSFDQKDYQWQLAWYNRDSWWIAKMTEEYRLTKKAKSAMRNSKSKWCSVINHGRWWHEWTSMRETCMWNMHELSWRVLKSLNICIKGGITLIVIDIEL